MNNSCESCGGYAPEYNTTGGYCSECYRRIKAIELVNMNAEYYNDVRRIRIALEDIAEHLIMSGVKREDEKL